MNEFRDDDPVLSALTGVVLVVLYVGVPLAILYGLVRFVKWAWLQ